MQQNGPGNSKTGLAAVGDLTSLAMTLAICVLIGLLGGRWVGKKLGSEDVGTLGGVAFGVVAAGYELRRVVRRMERRAGRDTGSGASDEGDVDDG